MGILTKLRQASNQPKFVGEGDPLLTIAGERALSDTIGKLVTEGFVFPVRTVKRICYEYCDANNVPIKFNKERLVSDDWFIGFLKRNPEVVTRMRNKFCMFREAAGINHQGNSSQRPNESEEGQGSDAEDDVEDPDPNNENESAEGGDVVGEDDGQGEHEEGGEEESEGDEEESSDDDDYEGNEEGEEEDISDSDIDEEEDLGDEEEDINDELQNVIDAAIEVEENAENVGGLNVGAENEAKSGKRAADCEGDSLSKKKKK